VKELLKFLLTRSLYYKAKEEGLVPQWFDTPEEKWFVKFITVLYESSQDEQITDPVEVMSNFADIYISDDTERTKFLLLVEEIITIVPNNSFDISLKLTKERFVSKLLTKSLKKATFFLKEGNPSKVVNLFQKTLYYFQETSGRKTAYDIKDRSIHEEALVNKEGFKIGYPSIDNATNGFRPGEMLVVVSGFAEGKSTLLLNIGYNVFMAGKNVVYFTLEMPYTQIVRRFDSLCTGIPYSVLKSGNIDDNRKKDIMSLVSSIEKRPNHFYVIDAPDCTPSFIDLKLSVLGFKPDLIIIDYLSLIRSEISYKSLWESLNTITVQVRNIARKYGSVIVTAAQVRRDAIERDRDFYEAQDIALAFSIIQHSDVVFSMRIDDPDVLTAAPICLLKCKFLKDRDGSRPSFMLRADFSAFKVIEPGIEV
jgi:replicative DNA helicase